MPSRSSCSTTTVRGNSKTRPWSPSGKRRRRHPPACRSSLLRFRLVDAVPVRSGRIGAVSGDAFLIHVVESRDIEAVGDLTAAVDQIARLVPFLLAEAGQHLRVELAQFPAARILLDLGAAEYGKHGFRLLLALH